MRIFTILVNLFNEEEISKIYRIAIPYYIDIFIDGGDVNDY